MSPAAGLTVRTAEATDARSIQDLLQRSGLPTSDLESSRPEFVVASRGERILGVGALERFGNAALLRSVAVEPDCRRSGVASVIVGELERRARAAGLHELVLLTLTAREVFERLGYRETRREQVPSSLLDSTELRSLCPASAVCMAKGLSPT